MPTPRSPACVSDRLTAIAEGEHEGSDRHVWNLCKMPFWQHGGAAGGTSASGSPPSGSFSQGSAIHKVAQGLFKHRHGQAQKKRGRRRERKRAEGEAEGERHDGAGSSSSSSVSAVARSLLARRRLKLDPATKLYFPYEPGKQVKSAVRIKNISKFHVAFKFQTTSPKSCFMRPPGAVLAPHETIVATVFKFVELPEDDDDKNHKLKFKILSLKANGHSDYNAEWFDKEKDHVHLEQILRVVFLDKDRASTQMDKLKRLLAEAEAAFEARKKLPEDTSVPNIGEGQIIDEWRKRREEYLAQQQIAGL